MVGLMPILQTALIMLTFTLKPKIFFEFRLIS